MDRMRALQRLSAIANSPMQRITMCFASSEAIRGIGYALVTGVWYSI
jgi:hypothetical protein